MRIGRAGRGHTHPAMRILPACRRHGHAAMGRRSHSTRSEAGDASAHRNPQPCRAGGALDVGGTAGFPVFGQLCLDIRQFSGGVARHAHCEAGHVISHEERVLALRRLHGAIAGGLQALRRLRLETPAVGGAAPGELLQLLLHRVAGRRGGAGWSIGFCAAAQTYDCYGKDNKSLKHCGLIVTAGDSPSYRDC